MDMRYAAGFFDGEGSVGMYYATDHYKKACRKYRIIQVQVVQTDRAPLDMFAVEFGGTVHEINPKNATKRTWQWTIKGPVKAQAMYDKIEPYLVVKREQFRSALERYRDGAPRLPCQS